MVSYVGVWCCMHHWTWHMKLAHEVKSDPRRLAQVLSNLLVQNDRTYFHTNKKTNQSPIFCIYALAARPQSVHIGARIDLNVQGCKMMQAYMAMAAKHLQTAKNLRATHDIAASTRRTNLAPRKITKLENWPIEVEKPNRRLGHPNCRTAETGIHRIGGLGIFVHSTGSPSHPNKVQNVQRISKVCHPLTVFNSWRLHQISRTSLRFLGSGPKGFWPEEKGSYEQGPNSDKKLFVNM